MTVTGEQVASRWENYGDWQDVTLEPMGTSICFLVDVYFQDIDGENEAVRCRIIASGANWVLRAQKEDDGDSVAVCRARCLKW